MSAEHQQTLDTDINGQTTAACPDCNSARSLRKRLTKDPEWACHECGHRFNEPNRRPIKSEFKGTSRSNEFLIWCPSDVKIEWIPRLAEYYANQRGWST